MRHYHDRQLAHGISLLDDETLKQDKPAFDLYAKKAFLDLVALLGRHLLGDGRGCGRAI
jgi:hypothetical protein